MKRSELFSAFRELGRVPIGELISDPEKLLFVGIIPDHISEKIGLLENTGVYISRMSLKHIIERRGLKAKYSVEAIPGAITQPEKVVDNMRKRRDSFLFLHRGSLVICVVVEKTKTTQHCQVVSAFPIHPKMYEKMVDISGRAEFPPFELPS